MALVVVPGRAEVWYVELLGGAALRRIAGIFDCLVNFDERVSQISDDSGNLIATLLRGISGDISHIKDDIIEIKERLGFLEGTYASLSRRVDRLGGDVERIKVRLDIVDAPVN
jgi:hypothetical protein